MSKLVIQKIKDRQAWVEGARAASRSAADACKRMSFDAWLKSTGGANMPGVSTTTLPIIVRAFGELP